MSINTYKILFLGDGGVGKTTFVKRLCENKFEQRYIATLGVDVRPMRKEDAIFNIWDCAGQEKFGGLGDGYYIQSQGAIFFFDLTSRLSLKNLGKWVRDCGRISGNIPMVVVGLKSDIAEISDEEVRQYIKNTPFIKLSSKTGENVEEPLRVLKTLISP